MREFFEKKIIGKKGTEIPKEIGEESGEKSGEKEKRGKGRKGDHWWREYYREHKERTKELDGEYRYRKKIISVLKFLEEEKPITFKELCEKRQIMEIAGSNLKKLKETGEIKKIINECKRIGLVIETEENGFQINPKSPILETFKRFMEREKKKGEI